MIMAFDFEAIRRDHPIDSIIAKAVKLRKAGKYKVGCCPFHPDRTPSFVVYDESYHCFGCGEHGDVIDYVAKTQHIRVPEAIAFLTGGNVPTLTDEDRKILDRERRLEHQRRQAAEEAAILSARQRWDAALPVNGAGSAYLERKKIAAYGARREGEWLLVPILNADGLIQSVQAIPPEPGEKKLFHAGAPVRGGRMLLGAKDAGPIVICEGFATGATVHGATSHMVAIAFSKGNMAAVAEDLRRTFPNRKLIIAADTDAVDQAHSIAETVGGLVIEPELVGADGSDFNDQAEHYGLEDVARTFSSKLDAEPTPLPLLWYNDIQPTLNNNWLVKNVLPAEAFATIIGHPGCGKSFGALDMALHIAAGMEWQGRRVKQGLVIYLAAEGQRGQQNRVEAWRRHHGVTDLQFAMIPVAINLRDREADVPKLIATINAAVTRAGMPLAVLFVDTLNRTFGGGDENGAEMTDYVDNVGRLKAEFGCTAVVIHHIPKNSENITERGHGSLRGAIETSLVVKADAESGIRTLHCSKQKDAEDGWTLQFKLHVIELGEDEDGDKVTSCVVMDASDEAAAVREQGAHLSPAQRAAFRELEATLQAAPVSLPADIPDNVIDRQRVGKVASLSDWRKRYIAIHKQDKDQESATRVFRRTVQDLVNKGKVGTWEDFCWITFR